MGDLARRFNLSSDLLLPVVTARLGSRIRGRLQGGLLFTPAFIARVKARALLSVHCTSQAWCGRRGATLLLLHHDSPRKRRHANPAGT